jgi:hypothetical protein
MGKLADFFFGNSKDAARKSGPHTGTGNSGTLGAQPKVTFRKADGSKVKPPKKK